MDRSNTKGAFRERVGDRPGVYRAIAVRKELNGGNNVCLRDLSPRVKHRHLAEVGDGQVAIAVGSALSVVRPQAPPPVGIGPGRAR